MTEDQLKALASEYAEKNYDHPGLRRAKRIKKCWLIFAVTYMVVFCFAPIHVRQGMPWESAWGFVLFFMILSGYAVEFYYINQKYKK